MGIDVRVKYIFLNGENKNNGVEKKVISQVTQLKNLGVSIDLVQVDSDIGNYFSSNKYKYFFFGNIYARIKRALLIRSIFARTISSLSYEDVLYCRGHIYPLIYYPSNFMKQFRKCKLVTEHQTIEGKESLLDHHFFEFLKDIIFGAFIRRQSDALIGVTDEITRYELARAGNPEKPHLTIGNGFTVESAPVRQAPHYNINDLHLLCVANVSSWHGLDRLLRGLTTYDGMPKVILHIAGNGTELPHLQKLASDLGINDRVVFHGFLTDKPLDELFDHCHIAVGSLGLHRIGMTQSSVLKGREYCARGIPFITACADPDFPTDSIYILRLPADESPIDIEQVLAFTKEVCADPEHPQKMRHYANEHLDWSIKMKKLKDFLEALVGENEDVSALESSMSPLAGKGLRGSTDTASSGTGQGEILHRHDVRYYK